VAGVAKLAVVISLSRFANFGLMLISPIVLVRLLSVEDFGRYREFLVYSGTLLSFATFGITTSLLYFVPGRPQHTWQIVKQATQLTFVTSAIVAVSLIVADFATGGAVVGEFRWPLVAYTLVFANVDFWEYLLLATHRPMAVFAYTSGRLVVRMAVVIGAAYFTRSVSVIIWSLVVMETLRLIASAWVWNAVRRDAYEEVGPGWRGMIGFCLPNGGSLLLGIMNRYSANIVVAKAMGPAALAHYTIGTYVEPIVSTLRNSLSDAMLPAMVGRAGNEKADAVLLWRRGSVVASILLLPIGALLARYADALIVTVFSIGYRSSVPVLQIFLLVLVRECFDFAVALKAINQTRYFLFGDVAAIILNLALLTVLMPRFGLTGAIEAYVASSYAEGIYLCWWVTRLYGVPVGKFVPWESFLKVASAAGIALLVTYIPTGAHRFVLFDIALGSTLYFAVYALLLHLFKVDEAIQLLSRLISRLPPWIPRWGSS
jgi:O-antigen/teichoic acid export membrane protein